MLDELLGRAELKARIQELEEEKHHLERQLAAESERRSDAVADRQQAEQRVNKLEDKIIELEDRLDREADRETATDRTVRGTESLRGGRLAAVLDRLRSFQTGPEGALSAAVVDAEAALPETVSEAAGDCGPLVRRAAPAIYYTDDAGLVSVALRPPITPEGFVDWAETFRVDESWFRPTGSLVFGVVRADVFAVGVYEDGDRTEFAGFESNVKSDHSKGGFSQGRFERIRNEQIDDHLDEARELLVDHIDRANPDRVILTGEQSVLQELSGLADHTASTDAGGKPEAALDHAMTDFWTTRLVRF
ncbi:Vms1/Ankzf1 family peptidyl-tRNA hydrolase [Halohasta litorea]|uniref:Vms1/Ankzf1 family peptidyl-tRNA hydrolase n=1 Tax=Halohasta litorea TaxID=869891 RepID=A0ABD6DBR0_9EURY|nr:Vms1/Ankzf1 family peptidyl-tRNA hydrolase [Halohasta litorea]